MFNVKLIAARSWNFVADNAPLILVTVAATAVIVSQRQGLESHNEFLKEHDLYDTFYAVTDSPE